MLCQLYYPLFYYRKVLESEHEWVNDRIINGTQNLMKCLYGTPGLQDTLLVGIKACDAVGRNEFLQVLHSGGNHWLTISSIHCPYSTINVYDSQHSTIPEATIKNICTFLMCSESHINVRIMDTIVAYTHWHSAQCYVLVKTHDVFNLLKVLCGNTY